MAAPDLAPVAFDEGRFREAFRGFHAQFSAAMEAGVDMGTLLAILEEEGVELPDWIRQAL